ncbi:cell division protein FtsB [Cognatilysobacter lacus]|uniref:Cell division protein FtsB n=1 Tax=Cognatilysobacter lacus TaxID=1643323 RepID=A0A5D8Z8Z5_9GAMM|nr:cell division protein FtsB [Lysobacter lacus]TZF91046.1 cell division protein FtsB [Lysobacter lacus]
MAQPRYALLILIGLLAVMLAVLQTRLWRGEGGREAVDVLQRQVDAQLHENGGLRQRNDALAAEVQDLKSGEAAVEDRARSELGMIRPGEVFYRVIDHAPPPAAPAPEPADTRAP